MNCFLGKSCLYNIKEDPCEMKDISLENPEIISRLQAQLETEMKRLVPRIRTIFRDSMAAPKLHNNSWATWLSTVQ